MLKTKGAKMKISAKQLKGLILKEMRGKKGLSESVSHQAVERVRGVVISQSGLRDITDAIENFYMETHMGVCAEFDLDPNDDAEYEEAAELATRAVREELNMFLDEFLGP
jgi:DNA primase